MNNEPPPYDPHAVLDLAGGNFADFGYLPAHSFPWRDAERAAKLMRALRQCVSDSSTPIDQTKPAYARAWRLMNDCTDAEIWYLGRVKLLSHGPVTPALVDGHNKRGAAGGATGVGGGVAAASALANFFAQAIGRERLAVNHSSVNKQGALKLP